MKQTKQNSPILRSSHYNDSEITLDESDEPINGLLHNFYLAGKSDSPPPVEFKPKTLKICSKCNEEKPFSEYYKNTTRKDGITSQCKDCSYTKILTSKKRCSKCKKYKSLGMYGKNKSCKKGINSRCKDCMQMILACKTYSISEREYVRLHKKNQCSICKAKPKKRKLDIDHNHITGEVRGLLCSQCNVAIGLLKGDETVSVLEEAIRYLRETDLH